MPTYLQKVALRGVESFAFHGYYPEEQLTGNHFVTDVEALFEAPAATDDIEQTVNYEVINMLIQKEMSSVQKLLETVIRNILDGLLAAYPFIVEAAVSIRKKHPPMPGQIDHSLVEIRYIRDAHGV
ncbi:dihydroneopterin aldolase [Pedobacter yulinensis]|uniref:7,8-dihydroneopterin aldolase n=1 Tax=Pedobacter yulinensis TaxID=2126353 RepID=A0A2T3HKH4_9SPHI|nr:dihydroneopterin aldolase [Pedobacter yulinensis]PST82919.1 dihydroneopterin aldolase [Pedobacter yulinensis]